MENKSNKRSSLLIKIGALAAICGIGIVGLASASFNARGTDYGALSAGIVLIGEVPAASNEAESLAPGTVTLTLKTEVTTLETVTVPVTFEKIIFKNSGYTPIFDRKAPEIEHAYNLYLDHTGDGLYDDDGTAECFNCHLVPQEHGFWSLDAEACARCHKVTPTPTITPPHVMPVYR